MLPELSLAAILQLASTYKCDPVIPTHHHVRCQEKYHREDYCATVWVIIYNKDGSTTERVLCGIPSHPAKVTKIRETNNGR